MEVNRKVVGACLVGCSLVAGAFIINGFNPNALPPERAALTVAAAPERSFIAVNDQNGDGVEDWREEFVTSAALVVPAATGTPFEMPDTLTDQVGLELFQSLVQSKTYGPFAAKPTDIISQTAIDASALVADELYRASDLIIIPTTPEAIRTYGNTMGQSLINRNVSNAESELAILNRALATNNDADLKKLTPLADMYRLLRDDALATPVPDEFMQEHLDVINVYNALYHTLSDLGLAFDDPMVALLRIKRYQDDADGLAYALRNLYLVAAKYANLFTAEDPAAIFAVFAE